MSNESDEVADEDERRLRAWWISNGAKWSWVVASAFRAWQKDPNWGNDKTRSLFERYVADCG